MNIVVIWDEHLLSWFARLDNLIREKKIGHAMLHWYTTSEENCSGIISCGYCSWQTVKP